MTVLGTLNELPIHTHTWIMRCEGERGKKTLSRTVSTDFTLISNIRLEWLNQGSLYATWKE